MEETGLFPEYKTFFAELILPVPVAGTFTYRLPQKMNNLLQIGMRVVVQFGAKRILTGIVYSLSEEPPAGFSAKYILEQLDDEPLISKTHIKFWEWIADYYMCTIGEVMQAALPAGLKLSSRSMVLLHPAFLAQYETDKLSDTEFILTEALREEKSMSYDRISELLNRKNIYDIIKSLIRKEVIFIQEEIKEKYKPKTRKKIRLSAKFLSPEAVNEAFDSLIKSTKQEAVLLRFLSLISINSLKEKNTAGVFKNEFLTKDISESSYNTLKKHGLFEEFDQVVSRFDTKDFPLTKTFEPADFQQKAVDEIMEHFAEKQTVLLHGVTGSGKTEIYIELIHKILENGTQALFLLPEIALTAQIVLRIKKVFGNKVGVYHSRFSDNERTEVWKGVAENRFPIVIGVRSAIFLPFRELGLIIVDEEHDSSYKQHEPAPRYNARDAANVLAGLLGAKLLLGSATPSLESYYLACLQRYGLVSVNRRYGEAVMPEILFSDTFKAKQAKLMKGSFTNEVLDQIALRKEAGEQVILFQNRRGYAPVISCEECGWTPQCHACSVSLSLHLGANQLRCHYCGYRERPPAACKVCNSTHLNTVGYGTERIEEELKLHYPEMSIARMDSDTVRNKYGHQTIIDEFGSGNIDALVGTQMVTKGLDFDSVSLVCVFDTDRMLHFPDFRAYERVFQALTQVSGRAGRREKPGLVLIQSGNPRHKLFEYVQDHDFGGFYEAEIAERERYFYPPFCRFIRITVRNEDQNMTEAAAEVLADKLRGTLGTKRLSGPESPPVFKIRNKFLKIINIKIERDHTSLPKIKAFILEKCGQTVAEKQFRKLEIFCDVDPV